MPFARLDDGDRLYYETVGNGPPLLLVTGVHGLASFWPDSLVEGLAKRFRVIVHDQRGAGRSTRSPGPYSVARLCADVLRLMDGLGIARAHVVGHSLGGAIAQTLALDHPARIGRLVLSATWPGPDDYFTNLLALRRDLLMQADWTLYARLSALLMKPAWWVRDNAAAVFGDALPQPPDAATREIMAARLDAVLAHDRRAELGLIAAPTLVIGARDDTWTPAYFCEELGSVIPGAETLILPEGQHFFPQVFPDRFAGAVEEFLMRDTETAPTRRAFP